MNSNVSEITNSDFIIAQVQKYLELSDKEMERLSERVWAFSSKVRQPRKDDRSCNKTPYFDRWDTNTTLSYITSSDSRFASKEDCQKIFCKLLLLLLESENITRIQFSEIELKNVEGLLGRNFLPRSLRCCYTSETITKEDIKKSLHYSTQRLGSFDIPVGYLKELNSGGQHIISNVGWMKPFHINYTLREVLRKEFIRAGASNDSAKNALDKIQVKAYCTDKFTMPPFFSNRDIRWATWPNSNQYASHYECCLIELELMSELFEFINAPLLGSSLKDEISHVRRVPIKEGSRKCYITGKELSFRTYLEGAVNPRGGKSVYHVSHVFPLTRGGKHSAMNIEWISEDGNRIQGNDTLVEIEAKLVIAVQHYVDKTQDFEESMSTNLKRLARLIDTKIR